MEKDTVCRLCSACCPVKVTVQNGRLAFAERKSFLPPGKMISCPKLRAVSNIVYSPLRLTTPLIKDEMTSQDGFREASWDEALNKIADKFLDMKNKYGPESICWLRGMAADWGVQWDYPNRLMNAFGSPNSIGNGSVCHVAREMAHVYTYGAMTLPNAKNSRCIVVWGKNDLNTCPPAGEAILYARQNGAKLIVIDPVCTSLAKMADIWLQIKPGHDGLLAMAMIHEIIANNLYDKDFLEKFSMGFESLKNTALNYPAEKVAERTWLEPLQIKKAARCYADAVSSCIVEGNGLDMQLQAFQSTRAVCMLRALTGNLDREGGDLIPQPVPMKNIQLKARLPENVEPVTCDYRLFDEFHPTWGRHAQSAVIDAILDESPYPIKMLIVQSGNPAVSMSDSNRVRKSFKKLAFMVVIDLFMTQTGRFADVILPAASCFEETQLNRAYMRNNPVILQNQVIDPVGNCWQDWKIIFELGKRLGLEKEFPWETVEDALDEQLQPAGINIKMLRDNPDGLRADALKFHKYLTEGFATPSGKVEFFSQRLLDNGYLPVPYMDGNLEYPLNISEFKNADSFIGISGERSPCFTHTQFRHVPELLAKDPEGFIKIHPDDASSRKIISGEWLEVSTSKGRIRMKARVSDKVHPGSVQIAWGWGEIDEDYNLNFLTDDDHRDPITGTPSNRTFICKIKKIGSDRNDFYLNPDLIKFDQFEAAKQKMSFDNSKPD